MGPVAGVDEVGRGSLCGPVVAAAVILPGDPGSALPSWFDDVRDSKAISQRPREILASRIRESCVVSVGMASPAEVDQLNVLGATMLAMVRAVSGLSQSPGHCLIDGNSTPRQLTMSVTTVVKGDSKCLAIAAASIVAKVERDTIMRELDAQYPGYDWGVNSGYPTQQHQDAILRLGITPVHRRSFSLGSVDDLFGRAG